MARHIRKQDIDHHTAARESLQDCARRLGCTICQAYPHWHTSGTLLALDWQEPAKHGHRTDADGHEWPHVTIAGGDCLSLLPGDVRLVEELARRASELTGGRYPLAEVYEDFYAEDEAW